MDRAAYVGMAVGFLLLALDGVAESHFGPIDVMFVLLGAFFGYLAYKRK